MPRISQRAQQAAIRHKAITDYLGRDGSVRVSDLSDWLGVSAVTVRADLEQLEERQVLRRTRGGAMPMVPRRFERPVELTAADYPEEKHRISALAADWVRSGDTVIIDAGSTMLELARSLSRELHDVVVVTNSLPVALDLEDHPGVQVVVSGGTLRSLQHSLVAPYGPRLFHEINADIAFIGCNGVEVNRGFTTTDLAEAETKSAMIHASGRTVFLADNRKLGQIATVRIAPIDDADHLITDVGADPEQLRILRKAGLKVTVA